MARRSDEIKTGDQFTIGGVMRGSRGQLVIDGVNPITRRKCKGVKLAVFVVKQSWPTPKK